MVRSDDVGGEGVSVCECVGGCACVSGCPTAVSRRHLLRGFAGLAALGWAPWSAALEGGAGPSDPVPGTPASAVGSLSAGNRLVSAVVIQRQWVITAAHVVNGSVPTPHEVVFRTPLGGGFSSRASAVHVHPEFISHKIDLALVKLESPVPREMGVARVFTGPLPGQAIRLVSHGGSTTLISTGENRIDAVTPDPQGRPFQYLFDYDGPELSSNVLGPQVPANGTLGAGREATLVSGDSGSAAFVVIDGQWGLAGINTFQATLNGPNGSGRVAGGMVLVAHARWMAETMRGAGVGGKPAS